MEFAEFSLFSLKTLMIYGAFFAAGLVDAVCGGGGLITLPAMMFSGFPTAFLFGTNQSSAMTGAVVSTIRFGRQGHIYLKAALPALPTAFVGAMIGARLNMIMPIRWLQMIMIILIPVVAVLTFSKKDFGNESHFGELSPRQQLIYPILIGLIFGIYQGFYGAGSGLFFMLSCAVLTKLDLVKASGTTKLVVLISIITGSLTYAAAGKVYWPFVIPATVCNIAGSYIGAGLAMQKGAKIIRPLYMAVLAGLMIKLILELL